MVAMFRRMLEHDQKRAGWSVGQAAWHLGITVRAYREIEAGERWPDGETFNPDASCAAGPRRLWERLA